MPKERKKVEVELEDLAIMVKEGFDEVHRTFELKIAKDKTEFEAVHDELDDIKRRLSNLDNRLDIFVTHDKRLVKVERELGFAV